MKQSLKICLLTLGLGGLLWTACKKEAKETRPAGKSVTFKSFSGTAPSVSGGRLVFTDMDHYDAYEAYLKAEINSVDTPLSDDDVLQAIEDGLGYTSLRHDALAEFEHLNASGWTSVAAIPEEHWISSRTTRAILNSNREVQVGDKIVRYVNPEYMVTVDEKQRAIVDAVTALPVSAGLLDIQDIDPPGHYMAVSGLKTYEFFPFIPWGPFDHLGKPLRPWTMNGDCQQLNPCVVTRTVNLTGVVLIDNLNNIANKGNYHIDWGDGATEDILSTSGQNQGFLPTRSHTYGSDGPRTITVSVKAVSPSSSGPSVVVTRSFNVNIISMPACTDADKMHTVDYTMDAVTIVRGHIKYDAWTNGFNVPNSKVLSYTECYKKIGSMWYRVKSNGITLCAKVKVKARRSDCVGVSDIEDYACSKNTYTRYAESGGRYRFYWNIVEARHEISDHGTVMGWDHVMVSCE